MGHLMPEEISTNGWQTAVGKWSRIPPYPPSALSFIRLILFHSVSVFHRFSFHFFRLLSLCLASSFSVCRTLKLIPIPTRRNGGRWGTGKGVTTRISKEACGSASLLQRRMDGASGGDDDVHVETVWHFGGKMIDSPNGPDYVGGRAVEVDIGPGGFTYSRLEKFAQDDLQMPVVDSIWFVPPGSSMANGLRQIRSMEDTASLVEATRHGVVSIYVEGTEQPSYVGDNEDDTSGWDQPSDADDLVVGAHVGVVHLISDSDRTSDEEFLRAMDNLGISQYRRKYHTAYMGDGVEVDMTTERVGVNERMEMTKSLKILTSKLEKQTLNNSPASSYRGSSDSDHDVADKIEGDEVNSMQGWIYYDPDCDHKQLELKPKLRFNPTIDPKVLMVELKHEADIDVSLRVCVNAKNEARNILDGSLYDTYAKLRTYILQLKNSDPEGTFLVEVDPVAGNDTYVLFRRMYVGFSCLRKGFFVGCRRMFALDGCFLEGEVKGMLLSAVGKDGNNQMYPIAWAVVESENRSSWTWFISILQEELGFADGTGWSVISDQQKMVRCGLVRTVPTLTRRPRAKAHAVPHPRSKKTVCGICAQSGHNARTCSIRVGVQAVVNEGTSRQVRDREMRNVMQGVGVYVNEITGNVYYRGSTRTKGVRTRRSVLMENSNPDQMTPSPPGTQPSQN
ncbi:hypothetical protein LINGRAHAP2_LOCUS20772 [Linum grandiflorum]